MTRTATVRAMANDLARRYQNGESSALNELYPLLIPYMVRKARCSGAGDDALDIAHDAFLRLATRLSDTRKPISVENVLAYATTATHRITLNALRKGRHSAMTSVDSGHLRRVAIRESQSPEAIVNARLCDQRRRMILTDALSKIAPCHSQVIKMHHIHGMNHAEIERVLGIPIGTVIAKLRRARAQLRQVLKDRG